MVLVIAQQFSIVPLILPQQKNILAGSFKVISHLHVRSSGTVGAFTIDISDFEDHAHRMMAL